MRERGIRVWDLETGALRVLEKSIGQTYSDVVFRDDARLISTDYGGHVLQWNIQDGTSSLIGMTRLPIPGVSTLTSDSRLLFVTASSVANSFSKEAESELICYDLENRSSRTITARGTRITGIAPDPTGKLLVTGNVDGVLRVGPISDEEPHMLIGSGLVFSIAVDPRGRWIAVGGRGTISLWRMPEGRPLHTLPRRDFLDYLRARTNLRAVPDGKSDTGYRLEWAMFPGWNKAPAR
jgi:hypothetical protein